MDKLQELMKNPITVVILVVVLALAIWASTKATNKVTNKAERDSIYISDEEAADMVKQFQNGYSDSGAMSGQAQQAPAPAGQ